MTFTIYLSIWLVLTIAIIVYEKHHVRLNNIPEERRVFAVVWAIIMMFWPIWFAILVLGSVVGVCDYLLDYISNNIFVLVDKIHKRYKGTNQK